MRRIISKCFGTRRAAVISSVVIVLLFATSAWAAWTLVFTGAQLKAQTGTLGAVTFSAVANGSGSIPANRLMPGVAGPLYVSANNSNTFAVTLRSIANAVVTNDQVATCPNSNFTVNGAAFSGVVVPAGLTAEIAVPGAITLASTAPGGASGSGCSGANVTVTGDLTYGVGT